MPQLDQVSTFPSQVVWLLITFTVLYILMWRVVLPRISATLENRQQHIDNDIGRAEELAGEAQEVLAAYEIELAKARAGAQEELHKAAEAAAAEAEKHNAALTERLSGEADAAHKRISDASQAAATNVAGLVEDIASQAVERLIGVSPETDTVRKAVNAAAGERS